MSNFINNSMIEEVYKQRRKPKSFLDKAPEHKLMVDLMQKTHSLVPVSYTHLRAHET